MTFTFYTFCVSVQTVIGKLNCDITTELEAFQLKRKLNNFVFNRDIDMKLCISEGNKKISILISFLIGQFTTGG